MIEQDNCHDSNKHFIEMIKMLVNYALLIDFDQAKHSFDTAYPLSESQ